MHPKLPRLRVTLLVVAAAVVAGCAGDDPEAAEALARLSALEPGPGQVEFTLEADDLEGEARLVVAQDPPNRSQLLDSTAGGLLVLAGDTNAVCLALFGGWECLPAEGNPVGQQGTWETIYGTQDLASLDLDVEQLTQEQRTIVGREATCLSAADVGGVADFEACFDDLTGILLRASGDGDGGEFALEPVGFSDPEPVMFTPPAEFAEPPPAR